MSRFAATLAVILLTALFSLSPSAAAIKALAIGDSITEGVGDETGKDGYPSRLQRELRREMSDAQVLNFGIAGEDTSEMLSRLNRVLAEGGDVLLIMEGTNDIRRVAEGKLSIETIVANLDQAGSRARGAGIEPVHATIIPPIDTSNRDRTGVLTETLALQIREMVSSKNRRLVDAYDAFDPVNDPDVFQTLYSPRDKRVGHPNGAGYDRLADAFADVLMGIDSVSPVVGDWSPGPRLNSIDKRTEIRVPVIEPKSASGLDLRVTHLYVNNQQVADAEGNRRRAEMVYGGREVDLGCGVAIRVVSHDRADPPNVLDKILQTYEVDGRRLLAGDTNFDCRVDGIDLASLSVHFGTERGDAGYDSTYDLDGDGAIDDEDFSILKSNFGKDTG